jgi:hypothetical protein
VPFVSQTACQFAPRRPTLRVWVWIAQARVRLKDHGSDAKSKLDRKSKRQQGLDSVMNMSRVWETVLVMDYDAFVLENVTGGGTHKTGVAAQMTMQIKVRHLAHSTRTVLPFLMLPGDDDYESLSCYIGGTDLEDTLRVQTAAPLPCPAPRRPTHAAPCPHPVSTPHSAGRRQWALRLFPWISATECPIISISASSS